MQLQLIFCCCSFVMRFCLFSDHLLHLFHLPLNQTISLHFVIRLLFFHQQEDPLSGKNCNLSVSHLKPPAAPKLLQNSCSKSLDPKVWRTYFSIFLLNSDHTLVNLSQSLKHGSTDRKFSFFFPKKTDWLKKWESRSVGDTMRNKSWESRRAGRSFTSTSCILLQDSALIFEWKEWEDEMRLLCSSYSWKKHTHNHLLCKKGWSVCLKRQKFLDGLFSLDVLSVQLSMNWCEVWGNLSDQLVVHSCGDNVVLGGLRWIFDERNFTKEIRVFVWGVKSQGWVKQVKEIQLSASFSSSVQFSKTSSDITCLPLTLSKELDWHETFRDYSYSSLFWLERKLRVKPFYMKFSLFIDIRSHSSR